MVPCPRASGELYGPGLAVHFSLRLPHSACLALHVARSVSFPCVDAMSLETGLLSPSRLQLFCLNSSAVLSYKLSWR